MTGNKVFDQFLMIFLLACTAATLGVFAYTNVIFKRVLPSDELEKIKFDKEAVAANYPETYKVEKLIINLPSRTKRLHFLEVELFLTTFKNGQAETLEQKKPILHDIIISVVGQMQSEELNSISGKILLETRLKKKINALHSAPHVKSILFSRFVVQ